MKNNLKNIAIIPARGGSKGIPKKNIKPLLGLPLIAYNITEAKKANHIDAVFVSTDCPEIAEISRSFGAEIIIRPDELANDTASSEVAIIHAINEIAAKYAMPEIVAFLQCTSPLTQAEDIDGTIAKMLQEKADSAFAATAFHYFTWKEQNGDAIGVNHDKKIRLRRQDREPEYLETGAVYAFSATGFLAAKHRFFGKTSFHIMPAERVHEIDEPFDFELAEILLRRIQRNAQMPEIKALIMDFDGVFTDDLVHVDQNGIESVSCSRSDGMGLELLRKSGYQLIVISKEKNPVVRARCEKLGIECYHGIEDKLTLLKKLLNEKGLNKDEIAYIGNDINDLECLKYAGYAVVPSDANSKVKPYAHLILNKKGGQGALRELAEIILSNKTL
jgi:YrbI family 3-deoxy-D-manno-octulosonate 8-phosphate phosphatase